jgi:hypothetical protein
MGSAGNTVIKESYRNLEEEARTLSTCKSPKMAT